MWLDACFIKPVIWRMRVIFRGVGNFRSAYHFVKKDSPLEVELAAAIQGLEEPRPAEESSNKGIKALLLSRKFMLSTARPSSYWQVLRLR